MSIYKSAVKKPITTLMVFVAVVVMGLYSLTKIPVDLYPEMDPPEWNKFLIAKLENDKFTTSMKEQRFWGNMKEEYEKCNADYQGVYKEE